MQICRGTSQAKLSSVIWRIYDHEHDGGFDKGDDKDTVDYDDADYAGEHDAAADDDSDGNEYDDDDDAEDSVDDRNMTIHNIL